MNEKIKVLHEHDYTEPDEIESMLAQMEEYKPPFKASIDQHIQWVEFCRALNDFVLGGDFNTGDEVWLNNCVFTAGTLDDIVRIFGKKPEVQNWQCPEPPCLICVNPEGNCDHGIPVVVEDGRVKTMSDHLLELYAQEQAGTDTMLDEILRDLQASLDGEMEMVDTIKTIVDQLELWSSGRQARDTWGRGWEKTYAEQNPKE